MKRITFSPRTNWKHRVETHGLLWHSAGESVYWNEGAYYSVSPAELQQIESASNELYRLFVAAGDHIVATRSYARFGVPERFHAMIERSWEKSPPALNYGRFDLGLDGTSPPKLFEFNCDTPTSLLEASIVQWDWQQEVWPTARQSNEIHEHLVEKWVDIKPLLKTDVVHFGYVREPSREDHLTVAYLADTARQAGLSPRLIEMRDIGWRSSPRGEFVDRDGRRISTLYKLYPWEWLLSEPFAEHIVDVESDLHFIEPIWKTIWSSKAILGCLWELFPGHANLLPASLEAPPSESYVRKPLNSREGQNVTVIQKGRVVASNPGSPSTTLVFQQYLPLQSFAGVFPVIGAWMIDGRFAGLGIREGGLITDNTASFVPHLIAS